MVDLIQTPIDKSCSCRAYPPASLARRRGAPPKMLQLHCRVYKPKISSQRSFLQPTTTPTPTPTRTLPPEEATTMMSRHHHHQQQQQQQKQQQQQQQQQRMQLRLLLQLRKILRLDQLRSQLRTIKNGLMATTSIASSMDLAQGNTGK